MKNNKHLIILFFLIAVLFQNFYGCGKRPHSNPLDPNYEGNQNYVISNNAKVLDKKNGVSLIDTTGSMYLFSFSGSFPDIQKGNIIIGSQGHGYLRKVESITRKPNNLFEVETAPASLNEAVIKGELDTTISLTFENSGLQKSTNKGLVPVYEFPPGVRLENGKIIIKDLELFSGETDNANVVVKIAKGEVAFTPDFDLNIKIDDGRLQRFRAVAKGTIEILCELDCKATAAFSYEKEIEIAKFQHVAIQMIGFVPVVEVITIGFNAGFNASAQIEGEFNAGFKSTAEISAGAQYVSPDWNEIWKRNIKSEQPLEPQWGETAETHLMGFVKPYINVELYSVAGPYIEIKPYLAFDGKITSVPSWSWQALWGIDGLLGFKIHILDYDLADYNTTFLSYQKTLASNSGELSSIEVTRPTSQSHWEAGSNQLIQWISTGNIGRYVGIYLYEDDNKIKTIAENEINDGSYYWDVPSSLSAGTDYKIKISSISLPNVYGYSGKFEITVPAPTITVTSPSSSSNWQTGTIHTIRWETTGNIGNYVDIQIYRGDTPIATIAANENNDGAYDWLLSTDLSSGTNYRVKISSLDYPDIYDYSDYFSITAMAGPTGMVRGSVIDAVTKNPLEGVRIQAKNSNNVLVRETLSGTDGTYDMDLPVGNGYSITLSKEGYITEIYENVNVEDGQILYLSDILQIEDSYSGNGIVEGIISNAINGQGVPQAKLSLRRGINVTDGNIITSTLTNDQGEYRISSLPGGNYTAEVSKSGFNRTFFVIVCIGGQTNRYQNASITPQLSGNGIRIVLTWGENPHDLDSHLTGPIEGSGERFHIYFSSRGDSTNSPFAFLDHDETDSYGPETITIKRQIPGVYRYSVHDYSNKESTSSLALSKSGAKVEIYQGQSLIRTFNVPTNIGGTLWTVFELNGSNITPINEMSYQSNSGSVTKIGIDPIFMNFKFPKK